MQRTAHVARTAYDLKHLNRLRVPEFWIVSIHLTSSGKSSNCYLPDDAPQTGAGGGADDYHFVPEKETIQLAYELDDPFAMIQTLKLELFRRFNEPPLWTLDLAKLGPDALLNGKHTLKFDGRVSKDATAAQAGTQSDQGMQRDLTALPADNTIFADFIDGYITIEHSPYKLRLTASDGEATPTIRTAWTYFHILLKKLVLELGPMEAVPTDGVSAPRQALDNTLYQAVKNAGLPASGAAQALQVFLISNIFKISSPEMNDNSGFVQYQTVWDDGARIPVIAKIRLLASDDSEVKLEDGPGAKALGKVKFLWDWEDTDPNGTQADAHQSQAAPKAFLERLHRLLPQRHRPGPRRQGPHLSKGQRLPQRPRRQTGTRCSQRLPRRSRLRHPKAGPRRAYLSLHGGGLRRTQVGLLQLRLDQGQDDRADRRAVPPRAHGRRQLQNRRLPGL